MSIEKRYSIEEFGVYDDGDDVYYRKEAELLADLIISNFGVGLEQGKKSYVELSGELALAILLRKYASGRLPNDKVFTFLSSLADKKTSNPVQRVEQREVYDIQRMIKDVVVSSPEIYKDFMVRAIEQRQAIRDKLGADEDLRLVDNKG